METRIPTALPCSRQHFPAPPAVSPRTSRPAPLTVGELQHLVNDARLVLGDAHVLEDLRHHLRGGHRHRSAPRAPRYALVPPGSPRAPRYLRIFRGALGGRHLGRLHRFLSRGAGGAATEAGRAALLWRRGLTVEARPSGVAMDMRPSAVTMDTRPGRAEIHFTINIHVGQLMHSPNLLDSVTVSPLPLLQIAHLPWGNAGREVFVISLTALKPLFKLSAFPGLTKNDSVFPLF